MTIIALVIIYALGAILAIKHAELLRMSSMLLCEKKILERKTRSKILKNSTGEKVRIFVFWPIYLITLYFT